MLKIWTEGKKKVEMWTQSIGILTMSKH